MSIDSNFHLAPGWGKHVQSDGSNVAPGSPDPLNYGFVQGIPGAPDALMLYNEGAKYAVVEIYNHRQLQTNTGRLVFSFDLTVDDPTQSQVFENDTILVTGGKKYNFSLQRIAATNAIQVSKQNGSWTNTGIVAPAFTPGKPMNHVITYGFDTTTGAYGIEAVQIDGQVFVIPFNLIELTAVPSTWAEGAYAQLQNCLGPNGGRTRLLYQNMSYTWA